jgi:hypothetical protein
MVYWSTVSGVPINIEASVIYDICQSGKATGMGALLGVSSFLNSEN